MPSGAAITCSSVSLPQSLVERSTTNKRRSSNDRSRFRLAFVMQRVLESYNNPFSSRKIVGNNRAKHQSQRKPQLTAEFFCGTMSLFYCELVVHYVLPGPGTALARTAIILCHAHCRHFW